MPKLKKALSRILTAIMIFAVLLSSSSAVSALNERFDHRTKLLYEEDQSSNATESDRHEDSDAAVDNEIAGVEALNLIGDTKPMENYLNSASAYVLIEPTSGTLIKKCNQNSHLPMASTTKTMTALVVIENCSLDEMVEVADEAVGVEGSSMYLQYGEVLSVRDLLYGLMLLSGNDAAVALAIHVGGSVEGFVDMMNARAKELGLSDTNFVTPNGLHDDEHYTTALELAKIGAAALSNDSFKEIVSTQYHTAETGTISRTMKNKNSLLWDYEGAIGIKTGYTMAAGRCLLFAAERDGLMLVGAVLNCSPMFEAAQQLLNYGFENYSMCKAVEEGAELARCLVPNGTKSILALVAECDIIVPVKKGTELSLEVRITLYENVSAPIIKGEEMGFAEFYSNGVKLGETALTAVESIPSRDFMFYLELVMRALQH